MSLNWDISKVADEHAWRIAEEADVSRSVKKGDKIMHPITNGLIWATMAVGIGEITEDNVEEFYTRLHFVEKMGRPFLNDAGKPYFMTFDDVRNRIGLRTNVFPKEARTKWLARQFKVFEYEVLTRVRRSRDSSPELPSQ